MSEARIGPHQLFAEFVARTVMSLQGRFLSDDPRARGDLARLRRTVGKPVAADAESWPIVFESFPADLMGRGDSPSRWETAAYIALGLYAQHMQSASHPMHVTGWGLGRAVRSLANPREAESREKPVMRRFLALGTASSLNEAVYHARGMIQQLRGADIPLDYVRFARDLVELQSPRTADAVRLRWARDLYHTQPATAESSTSTDSQQEPS